MSNIIESLKDEHALIEDSIEALLKMQGGCPVGTENLARLESLILNHVSKEDSQIYGPLKKIIKLTPQASKFLEASHHNLESIKILALVFFEKFKGEKSESLCSGFHGDLKRLSEKIKKRIVFEDHELFPFLTNLWKEL